MRLRMGLPAAVLALSATGLHSGTTAPAATQCRAGEAVIYSCSFGRSVGSVCGSAGAVHYRYGPAGTPSLDLASAADWSNVHVGSVHGQGAGGYQEHVRFSNNATHYVVFSGADGELADHPGRTYSGIAVLQGAKGEKTLATLSCAGHARMPESLTDAVRARGTDAAGPADEETDGPFDAWF